MVRLFRAWSVLENFMGQDQVMFNWFVVGRQAPVAPYEILIENYDEDDEESAYDRLLVDELLTAAEVEELRNYLLKKHKLEIQVEEVSLPVRSGGLCYELLLISGQKDFYTLADEKGYNLSVAILGHFDMKEYKPAKFLSSEDLRIGTNFLEKVLENLKISGFQQNDLIAVLNKIYTETGFWVQKDTRQSELN